MATLVLSQSPSAVAPIAAMSSRRGPLTSNPHAANSPLRAPGALSHLSKQKRSYAHAQREDAYGQPPPIKKQVIDNGSGRPAAVRSPSKLPRAQGRVHKTASHTHVQVQNPALGRPHIKERSTSKQATTSNEEQWTKWKDHYRAKFPKMVFYFDNIADDTRAKLTKRIGVLGAVSAFSLSVVCP
jgi:regulatory subunit for Cdc7p protein kinase